MNTKYYIYTALLKGKKEKEEHEKVVTVAIPPYDRYHLIHGIKYMWLTTYLF